MRVNIRNFLTENFETDNKITAIFNELLKKKGIKFNFRTNSSTAELKDLEDAKKQLDQIIKQYFFSTQVIDFFNKSLEKYGIIFSKNKVLGQKIRYKKIGNIRIYKKSDMQEIINIFEDKKYCSIHEYIKDNGASRFDSLHSIVRLENVKPVAFCCIRNETVYFKKDIDEAIARSDRFRPTPIHFKKNIENFEKWWIIAKKHKIKRSIIRNNITSVLGAIFIKHENTIYIEKKDIEKVENFLNDYKKNKRTNKKVDLTKNNKAVFESWNRRRSEEWQIDIEKMTFRNEKIKIKNGRWVVKDDFDICFEYYKTVENSITASVSFSRAVTRNIIKNVKRS